MLHKTIVSLSIALLTALPSHAETMLNHWPAEAAEQLNAMIKANAHKGAYAVFDADNTSYRYDLEESLLPYLEAKGILTRKNMNPALKIIPFKDVNGHKESLNSYYYRLCEIDDQVCYPWVAQIFSGFTLRQLNGWTNEMIAAGQPIPATYYEGDEVKTIEIKPPKFYTGMQELYNKLHENGIAVYAVSAASEELIRGVLAHPKNGYNIKPENVIGVGLQLKNRQTSEITNSRKLIADKKYNPNDLLDYELTPALWAPMTWFEGKQAAIYTYIDEWKKPILVAGDTPVSDGPMLFRGADVEHGGLRVWVNRKDKYLTQIQNMQSKHAKAQAAAGLPVTADKNWIVVKPEQIQ
ncbi:MAG: haloacid dehalogenase-like hydrolase [Formosimonas sp.]